MANADLTLDFLIANLRYDRETGAFYNLIKRSHRSPIGSEAGYIAENGYRQICLGKKIYYAHRLAWFYVMGEWPEDQIDHKNGIRLDNSWKNLRSVSCTLNHQNIRSSPISKKSTLLLGAVRSRGRWRANIRVDGRKRSLGVFDTAEEAHAAYIEAKRRLHPGCTL